MALPTSSITSLAWAQFRQNDFIAQYTADLTSYSAVSYTTSGTPPNNVVGNLNKLNARELGIDNSGNPSGVMVQVGNIYSQSVPPYTITTIDLGETSPLVTVTGGGVCVLTFASKDFPGTEVATNPYAAALGAIGVFLPSGVMMMFAGPVGNIPTGWALCDGSAISRANYASLFNAIGTLYGAGDGSSTFNLPDMRGRFPRGYDNGAGVDPGRTLGSYQGSAIGRHYHVLPNGQSGAGFYSGIVGGGNNNSEFGGQTLSGSFYSITSATTPTAGNWYAAWSDRIPYINGSDTAAQQDTYPKNVAVNFMIKL